MKKIILLALTAILIVGCYKANAYHKKQTELVGDYVISAIEYSDCEYVVVQSYYQKRVAITHKGNCKYCALRRK